MTESQLRGQIFEIFCRYLVETNGFKLAIEDHRKVFYGPGGSTKAINFAGRGTTHQIDLPYDYIHDIPLLNPIRLIGEVKCFSDKYPVEIKHVRDFFGVIEDIKQNYFLSDMLTLPPEGFRKSEQALFISASGFSIGAQKFALAHNIKILSFGDSKIIASIKKQTQLLANQLYTLYSNKHISLDELNEFVDELFKQKQMNPGQIHPLHNINFTNMHLNNFFIQSNFNRIVESVNKFKSIFLATTKQGQLMLFMSYTEFPRHLFRDNPETRCAIYYYYDENGIDGSLKLVMRDESNNKYEYYSTIPTEIIKDFIKEHDATGSAIYAKYNYFSPISLIHEGRILRIVFDEVEFNRDCKINLL